MKGTGNCWGVDEGSEIVSVLCMRIAVTRLLLLAGKLF